MEPVPPRIESDRLVIRRWEPADAPLLKDAVDTSLAELRAWMDWAPAEPEPVEDVANRLLDFRDAFDEGENGIMGAFSADGSRVLGGTGLHERVGPFGLEIGYWIRSDAVRRGYATEVAAVLTRVGLELCGADRIEIRIDPANEPSLGVPRKLGFREEATLRRRLAPLHGGEPRDVTIFTLFAEELAGSACTAFSYRVP
jgi:RimJ/RimL family protein N-acetyltransferase